MGALSGGAALGGLIGSCAGVRTAIWIGSVIFALSWLIIYFSPLQHVRRAEEFATSLS